MTQPVDVRRLTPAHAPAYRRLMLEAYTRHPEAFTSSAEERAALPEAWWEARLAEGPDAPEAVFGAFVGDELAGTVGLLFEPRAKGRHKATLFGMMVDAAHRRHGLGAQLVVAALDHARSLPQLLLVQLTVTDGNDGARALYERFGFQPWGREPYAVAVGGRHVAKIHMWCPLRALPTPRENP